MWLDWLIGDVCVGTGVGSGSYDDYCARPVSVNDLHGVGAFLLLCAERQAWLDTRQQNRKHGAQETGRRAPLYV